MNDIDSPPVPGGARPAPRILRSSDGVQGATAVQDQLVEPGMALSGGNEADRAVAVFVVVPLNQRGRPGAGGRDVRKRIQRVRRTIFKRPEQGFRVRIVVADGRTTQRWHDAQLLQRRQHRGPFH